MHAERLQRLAGQRQGRHLQPSACRHRRSMKQDRLTEMLLLWLGAQLPTSYHGLRELLSSMRTSEAPSVELLRFHQAEILRLAERRGISRIRVFGSVARGDATHESDIDLLVDFDKSHRGLDLFAFERELEELLGYPVDVATEVHPVIRDKVDAQAVLL